MAPEKHLRQHYFACGVPKTGFLTYSFTCWAKVSDRALLGGSQETLPNTGQVITRSRRVRDPATFDGQGRRSRTCWEQCQVIPRSRRVRDPATFDSQGRRSRTCWEQWAVDYKSTASLIRQEQFITQQLYFISPKKQEVHDVNSNKLAKAPMAADSLSYDEPDLI